MPPTITLAILVSVLLILVIALLAWYIANRDKADPTSNAITMQHAPDARHVPGERKSSLVAEQIEEMVRNRLDAYPDLADVELDFGTVEDGSIDIWVGGVQYDNAKNIPDERIRTAIAEAVTQFNT